MQLGVTKFLFLAVTVLIASSCNSQQVGWRKQGGNEEEFRRDRYECEREAALMYGTRTEISQTGGYMIGRTYIPSQTSSYDGNAGLRAQAFKTCLELRGYSLIRKTYDSKGVIVSEERI